jgi:TonB family protein
MPSTAFVIRKAVGKRKIACLVFAVGLANLAHSARAQQNELDKAASHIAERIIKKGRKSVIVADFIGPREQINELGRQFSDEFSLALGNANHDLEILPRKGKAATWQKHFYDSEDILEGNTARVLAKVTGAEVVIVGDMKRGSSRVDLTLRVWDIPPDSGKGPEIWEASKLDEMSVRISLTPDMEALLNRPLAPAPAADFRLTAGLGRAPHNPSVPACIDCPPPSTMKKATITLVVTIDAKGQVTNIEVAETSDQKVVKTVVETVKRWRFRPAHGPDDQPIRVQFPVVINTNVSH